MYVCVLAEDGWETQKKRRAGGGEHVRPIYAAEGGRVRRAGSVPGPTGTGARERGRERDRERVRERDRERDRERLKMSKRVVNKIAAPDSSTQVAVWQEKDDKGR
jgi:hypothetical protein